MSTGFVSRGFKGRRRAGAADASRLPPGQYLDPGFPVLSAGPTPRVALDTWDLRVDGRVAHPQRWTWEQFLALPRETPRVDIHCVTKWSKLDTTWEGVSLDTILEPAEPLGGYLIAHCDGGYTTNLSLEDVTDGKAWIAFGYDGEPLAPEHGGPARLLVPHLYFWKSAKWVRRLEITDEDEPGFWESAGYHMRGDPWKEERYSGD
jgi:DMSO/TMAO reductase YedYZ molybdopterin-dependent catalytic subunit